MTSDAESLDDCDSMVEANNLELKHGWQIESLDLANRTTLIFKLSIEEAPTLELKPLPPHLKYVFLGDHNTLLVIVFTTLDANQEEKLFNILKQHKRAIAWSITDIQGISLSFYMHQIKLEDEGTQSIEQQRRLNEKMKEVFKKEIIK